PNVARRYFSSEESVPTPPLQLFLKNKPQNGKRIFVLGGSSAAGFPYSNNLSFPKLLESRLALAYPKNNIEVINVAMAAINSYSLLDMVDEVLEESPDAVLIYAGHNEFYGALGVGSVQSLGSWRGLIRTYLKLHKVKSFLMIKDFIIWIKTQIGETLIDTKEGNQSSTLMARIVSEQTIPLDSDLYSKGKEQYLENMELILGKIKEKNIPVLIGELVSNIKDQKPFVSVKDEAGQSAESFFKSAKIAEEENDFISAKENYLKAKDFDALRFRSTEEFNEILHSLSDTYDVPIVPLLKYFTNASQNGIYGNNLFLEHLHPNKEGYNLISKAFFEALQINNTIKFDSVSSEKINFDKIPGYTDLDSVYASLVIKHLKGGWPFKSKNTVNMFFQTFKPKNKL
ncbi:MAG: SGNH/GDSL hydrolase family protein, partial [Ignavibacteriae bacterium]|nr:SGNH/GDSL hydrolase family protein [Ignavibacteriota bacterium]